MALLTGRRDEAIVVAHGRMVDEGVRDHLGGTAGGAATARYAVLLPEEM